jgi:hypothetical protein
MGHCVGVIPRAFNLTANKEVCASKKLISKN